MSDRIDDVFKALADPHRRKILAALCRGPVVAGDLARLVGLAPNAVSFHLKWLRSARLVKIQREGRFLRYQAELGRVSEWIQQVHGLFDARRAAQAGPTRSLREPGPVRPGDIRRESASPLMAPRPDEAPDVMPTELL